ncbi:protease modulator HflC [Bermanella sp. WJH001]|uniref:protease modulator HflC n=1 Tax=Bermanella sp. WJH001 TaxID=3048005 RepID=UPI0024BDB04C|nr:protease modulator HflC [Bermanella sp. WJH001]MDJ1538554.1 protease modulator HflC [Bermanella sp. WJH001]
MSPKSIFLSVIAVVIVLVGFSSVYMVNETERAIKLRFGEIIEDDIQPGIHIKVPMIDNVKKFDARILTLDARPERFLTAGKKFLIVDSFVKWRIENVRDFYKATSGDRWRAAALVANLVNDGIRAEFANRTVQEVVSGERDELMLHLTKILNEQSESQFGIKILDTRVKGIDLPDDLMNNVYRRMSAEREREARELRSQGKELAEGIRADADRQKTVLVANAYKESEVTRGEGDAIASAVYAKAFNRDPEFYAFTRSLKAYEETFNGQEDVLLLKPDSDFFKYMKSTKGK